MLRFGGYHIPWTFALALLSFIGGAVCWVVMFCQLDHDEIAESKSPFIRNYIFFGAFPAKFLAPAGLRARRWYEVFLGLFLASIVLTALLYSRS